MGIIRRGSRVVPLALLLITLVACGQSSGTVRGVITSVEGDLDEISAFTTLVEGSELRFLPVEDGAYDFPLAHLREHLRTGEPVLVGWEEVGSVRYALSLADG
jgi:hypothetical protein